jgi:hypothetical protein
VAFGQCLDFQVKVVGLGLFYFKKYCENPHQEKFKQKAVAYF